MSVVFYMLSPLFLFMVAAILLAIYPIRKTYMTNDPLDRTYPCVGYPHYYIADCSEGVYDMWLVEDEYDYLHEYAGTYYDLDEAVDDAIMLEGMLAEMKNEKPYTL